MKSLPFLLISLCFTLQMNAQSMHIGVGVGTGFAYVDEYLTSSIKVSYTPPLTSHVYLNFNPNEWYFDIKLQVLYLHTQISGTNWNAWSEEQTLNGHISSYTTSLRLERMTYKQGWNIGYHLGVGYTNEFRKFNEDQPLKTIGWDSMLFGGNVAYSITQNWSFELNPTLLL